jgi:hypothetical protein
VAATPVDEPLEQRLADDRGDLALEPARLAGGIGGVQALDHRRCEPLREDRAQELANRGVSGTVRHHFDGHAERAQRVSERLCAGARCEGRRSHAAGGNRSQERDVCEPCAGPRHDYRELTLEGGRGRVQIGVDGIGAEPRQRRLGRGEGGRGRCQGEHEAASGDGRRRVAGLRRALGSRGDGVVSVDLDPCADQVCGEPTTRLAETEHGHDLRSHRALPAADPRIVDNRPDTA